MRSIVILALFALAANAFNYTAFSIGEAQQFGLTEEQIQTNGLPCFNAFETIFGQAIAAVESKNVATILSQISPLYQQFQTDLQTTCQAYFIDLISVISQKVNLTQDVMENVKQNFVKYLPEIYQQVDYFVNELVEGQDFQAGITKAIINQILLGITTPEVPAVPQLNVSLYTPFNQEEFVSQYFPAFFSTIGDNDMINTEELNTCVTEMITFVTNYEYLFGNYSTYNFSAKVQGISSFLNGAADLVQSCEYGAQIYAGVFAPIIENFHESPVSFILKLTNNILGNNPQIVQSVQQEEIYILQGQYALAGETKGTRFMQVFGFALSQ